jgi:hypothetical protein
MLGLPIVPSIGNLDFWLRLCNVRGLPESQALLAGFPQSEERGKEGHAAAVREWNADLIRRVRQAAALACVNVEQLVAPGTLQGTILQHFLVCLTLCFCPPCSGPSLCAVFEPAGGGRPACDAAHQGCPPDDARLPGRRHPALRQHQHSCLRLRLCLLFAQLTASS